MNSIILNTAYLPPIAYYKSLLNATSVLIEHCEYFQKQTYRNRCNIYGANGILNLSIPIQKRGVKTLTKDVKISYADNWQKLHWRSLQSAYRSSPFFEFYEDDFVAFYESKKHIFLIDFNAAILATTLKLLDKSIEFKNTTSYYKKYDEGVNDHRNYNFQKLTPSDSNTFVKPYIQVFENKHGFIPNLSIVDVLFNQGAMTTDSIKNL